VRVGRAAVEAGLEHRQAVFDADAVGQVDLRVEGERPAAQVRQVAPGRYRVDGDLLVRDWNEAFGRDVVPDV
jgi:hypothetical protein